MKKEFKIVVEVEEPDFCFSDLKDALFDGIDNMGNHKCCNIEQMETESTVLNTEHYAVEVKETEEGVVIDVFQRHGELIDTYTYWNDDVVDPDSEELEEGDD